MKRIMSIDKKAKVAHMTNDMIREGYFGKVEVLSNFSTMAILRPGTTIDEQISSLQRLVEDLENRKAVAAREDELRKEKTAKELYDSRSLENNQGTTRLLKRKIDAELQ